MNALVPLSLMRPGEARVSWSDEAVEAAKRLSTEGMSAGQIARIMSAEHPGITRNAVIGKLHRLGCAGGGRQANRDKPIGPRSVRCGPSLRPTVSAPRVGQGVRVRSVKRARLIERDTAAPESLWITILDLSESTCRWPKGDPADQETFAYCGAQVERERSYCPHHCRLSYVGNGAAYAKSTERNQWLMKA